MAVDLDALIRAVRTNPEARDTLRRELLTEELLGLPGLVAQLTARMDQLTQRVDQLGARMDQLTQRVDQLGARMDQLTQRVEQLGARMDQLTQRVDQLTAGMEGLTASQAQSEKWLVRVAKQAERADGRVGDLWGKQYEARVLRTPFHVEDAIGAAPGTVRPLSPADLEALVNPAVIAGALPREERAALGDANGIFVWDRGAGSAPVYCVVEISATVDAHDVERAAQRAAWLAKTGVATRPVVMGDVVEPGAKPAMDTQRVAWERVPLKGSHKLPTS